MKILMNTDNLARIAPIGAQLPSAMTQDGEGLTSTSPVNNKTNVLPSKKKDTPTLPYTDATTLFVEDRDGIEEATDVTDGADILESILAKKARPYCMSMGQLQIPILGMAEPRLKTPNAAFDGQLLDEPLTNYLGVSLKSKGSTTFASYHAALENINVKVQNSFNRPLPMNTWTEEGRMAAMYNYSARTAQLAVVFDVISGMVSFIYDKAKTASMSTANVNALYSPTLYARLTEAYNAIKQFPVFDTLGLDMIQRYSKIYSVFEKSYYPGAYHQFTLSVPHGNASGTIGEGVNALKFTGASALGIEVSGYNGTITTGAIHEWIRSGTLETKLANIASVANVLTQEFAKVIQFCIQAKSKGIFEMKPLGDYIDFNDDGLCIYAIEKDYHINNVVKNIPQVFRYEDGTTNKSVVLSQLAYGTDENRRVFKDYMRYVSPYCMKDDIFTTYELLSSKVWEVNESNTSFEDAVTGLCLQIAYTGTPGANGVKIWYSVGSQIEFPLLSSAYVNIGDADKRTKLMVINEVNSSNRAVLNTAIARVHEIIDQFDLYYLVLPIKSDAGARDFDMLVTDIEEDAYFMTLSESALETPNADVYASLVEPVTWLDVRVSGKSQAYHADNKKPTDHQNDSTSK